MVLYKTIQYRSAKKCLENKWIASILLLCVTVIIGCTKSTDEDLGIPTHQTGLHTFYVEPTGDNSNNGKFESPWKTINTSIFKLTAGDTLFVRGGSYAETLYIGVSGTASSPIVIQSFPDELAVIDGQNTFPNSDWASLVNIIGNYIQFSGFEVKNTILGMHARGVTLRGHHNTVSNLNVHHTYNNGILINGDFGIVQDCKVWQSCYNNLGGKNEGKPEGWASGLSAARDAENGITDNAIIRRNIVYNNWGEGLSTYEAKGTLIEDNVVYDNYAQNIYISDASNVIFQRNMVYTTPQNVVGVQRGSALADEVSLIARSENNKVINNVFLNVNLDAFAWTLVPGSGLTNALIANNTFVNSKLNTGPINNGSRISNNIFTSSGSVYSASGIVWRNNLWQEFRPANATGQDDLLLTDPLLSKTGPIDAGKLTIDYFKLKASSPAINKAVTLYEIVEDIFKSKRNTSPDIGAVEYQ